MTQYRLDKVNFFDPRLLAHPYTFYRQLHAEAPVLPIHGTDIYLVSSYALVQQACGRVEDFSNDITTLLAGNHSKNPEVKAVLDKGWPQLKVLLMSDPPQHSRFRRLVSLAFSLKRVDTIEQRIRSIAQDLIEAMAEQGQVDFVDAFAVPLPIAIIAGELGLPPQDVARVKRWSTAFVDRLGGMVTPERELECAYDVVEFQLAMKAQIDIRLAAPQDDLLNDLVHATVEGEEPLSIAELMSILQQLVVAGNESTTNTLAEGMLWLTRTPSILPRLRAEPKLIPNVVEEILRLTSVVAGNWRIVRRDTELGGVALKAGSKLMLRLAAANLDPARFDDPERFDPERTNARSHLAFGRGIHQCLGNLLARRELAVALEMLSMRFDTIILDCDPNDLVYPPNALLRGPAFLPLRLQSL